MDKEKIIAMLPYAIPFHFVDELIEVDENGATGSYTFAKDLEFYRGHFMGFAVTPAVILTEAAAQIGVVCLGIYLLAEQGKFEMGKFGVAMSSCQMEFLKPVFPGEKVRVSSEKIYFRFNKLSCRVRMENQSRELVCRGVISGMLTAGKDGGN